MNMTKTIAAAALIGATLAIPAQAGSPGDVITYEREPIYEPVPVTRYYKRYGHDFPAERLKNRDRHGHVGVVIDAQVHVDWCRSKYQSYRAWDDTFQSHHGDRKRCHSPYVR